MKPLLITLLLSGLFVQLACESESREAEPHQSGGAISAATGESEFVPEAAERVSPLLISRSVPDLTLNNVDGEPVNLRQAAAEQPAMFVFYRGGWCPYCSAHLADLAELEDEILDAGVRIYAISADDPQSLAESRTEEDIGYTLLSDPQREVSRAFGVAFRISDEQEAERLAETTGQSMENDGSFIQNVPAVFLVDTDGAIRFQYVNPDYTIRIDAEVLMAAVHNSLD